MNKNQKIKCNTIIHAASASAAAVGAGLAQVPCSDSALIIPAQIGMAISLGKVFGLTIDEGYAKSLIASAAAATIGRSTSQVLLGWIPGLGNAINAGTAAALTETIGWIMAKEFEKKSMLEDIA